MRLTDEQVMQDNKIFAHHNVLTELKYCGWEIPNRKSISNADIHFYAWLCRSAVALLKEQEPRVMAPTEAYTADFVYVEFDGVITPALRTSKEREGHRESYFATQQLGGEWMRWDDYGITWRGWTSRPTDEQRKAVKWND